MNSMGIRLHGIIQNPLKHCFMRSHAFDIPKKPRLRGDGQQGPIRTIRAYEERWMFFFLVLLGVYTPSAAAGVNWD